MNAHLPEATKQEMKKISAVLHAWDASYEESKDPHCTCALPMTDGGTFCFYCGKHMKPK